MYQNDMPCLHDSYMEKYIPFRSLADIYKYILFWLYLLLHRMQNSLYNKLLFHRQANIHQLFPLL